MKNKKNSLRKTYVKSRGNHDILKRCEKQKRVFINKKWANL